MGLRTDGRFAGKLVAAFVLASVLALPVQAGTPEEEILASLEAQGYHLVVRDRTWLGRIWMIVESDEVRREIVFNPGTGEILRDYAVMRFADLSTVPKSRPAAAAASAPANATAAAGVGLATTSVEIGVASASLSEAPVAVDTLATERLVGPVEDGPIIMVEPIIIYPAEGQ